MTKTPEPHYVPAVVLRDGDVIVGIDPAAGTEPTVIATIRRIDSGPMYLITTDNGAWPVGAATKVALLQANTSK